MTMSSKGEDSVKKVDRKGMLMFTGEERDKFIHKIQAFFLEERDEEIGIIAAEAILEFFLESMSDYIHNKCLDEIKVWFARKCEDMEVDYDMLYKV